MYLRVDKKVPGYVFEKLFDFVRDGEAGVVRGFISALDIDWLVALEGLVPLVGACRGLLVFLLI